MLVLSLGSNIGDREHYLTTVQKMLNTYFDEPHIISHIYITEPWGVADQPEYFNQVLAYQSPELAPEQILDIIQTIELSLGRERTQKWGARTIDIDILMIDDIILQTSRLMIPHPLMCDRLFVLKPLADILPHSIHPVHKKKIVDLLSECRDTTNIQKHTQLNIKINTP